MEDGVCAWLLYSAEGMEEPLRELKPCGCGGGECMKGGTGIRGLKKVLEIRSVARAFVSVRPWIESVAGT